MYGHKTRGHLKQVHIVGVDGENDNVPLVRIRTKKHRLRAKRVQLDIGVRREL